MTLAIDQDHSIEIISTYCYNLPKLEKEMVRENTVIGIESSLFLIFCDRKNDLACLWMWAWEPWAQSRPAQGLDMGVFYKEGKAAYRPRQLLWLLPSPMPSLLEEMHVLARMHSGQKSGQFLWLISHSPSISQGLHITFKSLNIINIQGTATV